MQANENPLVSIAVITYNSAKYVTETLESIKAQTYAKIELIISDDHSTDNTVKNCQQWIEKNKERFIRTELITIPENTGVSANMNRGIKAAQGEWVKPIAGDDILLPQCIEDNLRFVGEHSDAQIIFSQVKIYKTQFNEEDYQHYNPQSYPDNLMHPDFTAEDQYNLLILSDRITYTPSFFFKKETILKVGAYDETDRLIEDYPMWLKLTRSGVKLYYFHKATVGYQIHPEAINNTGYDVLFKPFEINSYPVRKKYAHPYLPWVTVAKETWKYRVSKIFKACGWTKNTAFLSFWYVLWTVYLNPFFYAEAISRRISKK